MAARVVGKNSQHRIGDRLRIAERHQLAAAVAQQFGGVPIRSRNNGFSRAEAVGERAGGDLRFVEIGREVDVRRPDEIAQLGRVHIAVHEQHIFLHAELAGEVLQRVPVALAFAAQEVRMRRAEDDVNDLRMLLGDARQGADGVFDSLARREEPEGQQHRPSGHAELVFVKIRIDERNVGNAVWNDGNFFFRNTVDLAQQRRAFFRHHHQLARAVHQFLENLLLLGIRVFQHRVERGDCRNPCAAQERVDVAAGGTAENAELVLQANHIGVREVQKLRRA